eukprot:scaffold44_cov339-Pavlova_lutheri.AAC.37
MLCDGPLVHGCDCTVPFLSRPLGRSIRDGLCWMALFRKACPVRDGSILGEAHTTVERSAVGLKFHGRCDVPTIGYEGVSCRGKRMQDPLRMQDGPFGRVPPVANVESACCVVGILRIHGVGPGSMRSNPL